MRNRRTLPRLVVTASIAAAFIATAAVAGAPVAGAAKADDTVIINCLGRKVVEPKQIVIACADAGVAVVQIQWTSWTANGARGSGTLAWNTCLPKDCASGLVEKYPVRITLGRVASGPGVSVFSRMTLAFPEGGPAAADSSRYSLDNAQR